MAMAIPVESIVIGRYTVTVSDSIADGRRVYEVEITDATLPFARSVLSHVVCETAFAAATVFGRMIEGPAKYVGFWGTFRA
jgi:hypothetical protein